MEPAATVLRAVLSFSRRLRAERPQGGVSLSALGILGTLDRAGPISATRLAREERLQPQSLSRLIASLEREGLIARTPDPADGRSLTLALTPSGREVLASDLRARRTWLETAMARSLSREERDALLRAAEIMTRLAQHDEGG